MAPPGLACVLHGAHGPRCRPSPRGSPSAACAAHAAPDLHACVGIAIPRTRGPRGASGSRWPRPTQPRPTLSPGFPRSSEDSGPRGDSRVPPTLRVGPGRPASVAAKVPGSSGLGSRLCRSPGPFGTASLSEPPSSTYRAESDRPDVLVSRGLKGAVHPSTSRVGLCDECQALRPRAEGLVGAGGGAGTRRARAALPAAQHLRAPPQRQAWAGARVGEWRSAGGPRWPFWAPALRSSLCFCRPHWEPPTRCGRRVPQ